MSEQVGIIDAEQLLEDGDLPFDAPPERFRNALRVAQCIEYGGPLPRRTFIPTLIQCRWRPGGVACRGTLTVVKTEHDEIECFCVLCQRGEFIITNWQDTLWAEGPLGPVPIKETSVPPAADEPPADPLPKKIAEQLAAALRSIGSRLSVQEVQRMIATTDEPNMVIQRVMESGQPRDIDEVQTVANALMVAWNATPRAELAGKTPARAYEEGLARAPVPAPAGPKVSRNAPCPCGSGIKHKKCCGLLH